jgi:hypothetical protein
VPPPGERTFVVQVDLWADALGKAAGVEAIAPVPTPAQGENTKGKAQGGDSVEKAADRIARAIEIKLVSAATPQQNHKRGNGGNKKRRAGHQPMDPVKKAECKDYQKQYQEFLAQWLREHGGEPRGVRQAFATIKDKTLAESNRMIRNGRPR